MAPKLLIRNWILLQTDWTQLPDNDLTQEEKDAWATYRQSLRNIKAETVEFEWPIPPKKLNISPEETPWWLDRPTRLEINI